jgi:hypothetical protein
MRFYLDAAADNRCLVSRNAPDYRALTVAFQEEGYPLAGVLLVSEALPNHAFAALVAALVEYARDHPGAAPPYFVDYLRRAREEQSLGGLEK